MLQRKKLCQAAEFMKSTEIDLWVTLARESTMARDPVLPMLADMYFSRLAAVMVIDILVPVSPSGTGNTLSALTFCL